MPANILRPLISNTIGYPLVSVRSNTVHTPYDVTVMAVCAAAVLKGRVTHEVTADGREAWDAGGSGND